MATASATALIVDAAHMPVYFWAEGGRIAQAWPAIVAATASVLVGTRQANTSASIAR